MSEYCDSAINLQQLNQISEGDVEFEVEVLQVYVEDVLQRLEAIRTAIANGDRHDVAAHGHQIKGSSSNVGAFEIRSLAAKIEDDQQDLQSIQQLTDLILEKLKLVELVIAEKAASL
ncbi:MAG: Hpt domain-containing protein [Pseudanabaenaceae cyanobacterium bins.39]|nr:Hpt domain-containing protein [Pseudanabaenaceae cyanobacterium bins.39]